MSKKHIAKHTHTQCQHMRHVIQISSHMLPTLGCTYIKYNSAMIHDVTSGGDRQNRTLTEKLPVLVER